VLQFFSSTLTPPRISASVPVPDYCASERWSEEAVERRWNLRPISPRRASATERIPTDVIYPRPAGPEHPVGGN